jgi:hypothetical protein
MSKIKLSNVRLSFPSLFQRASFNGEETKFEATFLMEKGSENAKKIEAAIDALVKENKVKLSDDKLCTKDGDFVQYDGYEGMLALKGTSNKRVTVINRDKSPIVEDDNIIYAGAYVNCIVDLWFMDNKYGKRVLCNLLGVQFAKDGEPFGAGGIEDSDFDDLEDF